MIALAPVLRAIDVRAWPCWSGRVVVPVSSSTPEGTANLVVVDGEVTRDGVSSGQPMPVGTPVAIR